MAFSFDFTADKLKKCVPNNKNPNDLFKALESVLPKYDITTKERVAGFLAQCGHESNEFTVLKENLNYGAKGLRATFSKYFPDDATAAKYEKQPEKIANKIYGGRMGNGPEASGDGYKYRGRGAIQLTGHDNYKAFSTAIGKSIDETITYLETLAGAIESAAWFWKKNGLNEIADKKDLVLMTKRINGGTIGLEDRKKHWEHALDVFGGSGTADVVKAATELVLETIKVGSKGEVVKKVQEKLGLTADGSFGPGTEKALKAWQTSNGLTADGIAGPTTLKKILG